MDALRLAIDDYRDETRWRWVLTDPQGRFLADHQVVLDPSAREYRGLLDLRGYLDFYGPAHRPAEQIKDLGAWIGEQIFGGLKTVLLENAGTPARALRLEIPRTARALLQRPLELARLAGRDGPTLSELGLALVWLPEGLPDGTRPKVEPTEVLRILACFSLPDREHPLNLRRERYQLQRFVERLAQTKGRAVELRVIQYGATRATLKDALEDAAGWDLIQLSGHGGQGSLLLETRDGGTDRIDGTALADLLKPARGRLKLLILDACLSGAASHGAARAQLGLEPLRDPGQCTAAPESAAQTALPSLAEALAGALDCAALAMRFPVGDAFATDLTLALYEKLIERGQALPAALHLALGQALRSAPHALDPAPDLPPLSPFTPILVGPRAAALTLVAPARAPGDSAAAITLQRTGLAYFPSEPPRFVGRLGPLLRASLALAPDSPHRGICFYGMAGAGKTACALETTYRHESDRFAAQVWYRGPEQGREIATALGDLLFEIERQLDNPNLGLAQYLDEPAKFRAFLLPRLKDLLERHALLLVLDNLENLLTQAGDWRDPLWGDLIAALFAHGGHSRTLLTSRRLPARLPETCRAEPIHALSLAESVLLARECPNLSRLFADDPGRDLLRRTLRVVQGHPKLMELADALAADREALTRQVAATEPRSADREAVLDAFFQPDPARGTEGESAQDETGFVETLFAWTRGASAALDPASRLLLAFLCRLEPEDRSLETVRHNWKDVLDRLQAEDPDAAAPASALALPELGLPAGLVRLATAGLIEPERPDPEAFARLQTQIESGALALPPGLNLADLLTQIQAQQTTYRIHPGVAEAVLNETPATVAAAADTELGNYHIARSQHGLKTETQGGGQLVVDACRRGVPYLLRGGRWNEASTLLEWMTQRDQSPESLAFAVPLLRRVCAATAGTERALIDAGVLAQTLRNAGRAEEAERELRRIVAAAVVAGQFRLASAVAGHLLNLLRAGGRPAEALALAGEMAGHTRSAGLGPWTQLLGEAMRLQILAQMGRYGEVLEQVDALRPRMDALPERGDFDETANPWNVREALLDTGLTAALHTERWDLALELNAEILKWTEARGAGDLELARTRFNDYGPLLRLNRTDDCRRLLQGCRAVFESAHYVPGLGAVYSALADLQDKTGDRPGAVGFAEAALRLSYQAEDPEGCAISHHNLSNCLERSGADPGLTLAHRLAAALLSVQTGSGRLPTTVGALAISNLPAQLPDFARIADRVEQVEGVRFRQRFARLAASGSAAHPDGDCALAAVWALVRAERERRGG